MKKPTAGLVVCLLLCGALIAGTFYLIGYKTAYDRIENAAPSTVAARDARKEVIPCGR